MHDVKWVVSLQHSKRESDDPQTTVYVVYDDSSLGAFRTALDRMADEHTPDTHLVSVDAWIHALDLPDADMRLTGSIGRPLEAVQALSNEELEQLIA